MDRFDTYCASHANRNEERGSVGQIDTTNATNYKRVVALRVV